MSKPVEIKVGEEPGIFTMDLTAEQTRDEAEFRSERLARLSALKLAAYAAGRAWQRYNNGALGADAVEETLRRMDLALEACRKDVP